MTVNDSELYLDKLPMTPDEIVRKIYATVVPFMQNSHIDKECKFCGKDDYPYHNPDCPWLEIEKYAKPDNHHP